MVIKDNLLHTGWSYGNGDDQYDNESIGSTKNVFETEKLIENPRRKDKNDQEKMIYSNHSDKHKETHTNDQGWTKIDTNTSRKPKSKSSRTTIDSIIASINIDLKAVKKGAPEAKIDSPARDNRCIIADTACNTKAKEFIPVRNVYQTLVPPGGEEEEGKGTKDHVETEEEENREKGCDQKGKNVRFSGDTSRNKAKEDERMETAKWKEGIMEMTPTSKEEDNKVIGISTMAINGPLEANQIETSNGVEAESNQGNQMDDDQDPNRNKDGEKSSNSNNNGGNSKQRVNILVPGDMDTYAFTVSWRPEHKAGKDGKIIIKNLMREMAHKTPSIIFHPTNSATSPVPRDINNINNDFPKSPASYDDFFDQTRNRDNTNQSTYMKVTMPHDEKELQKKLSNYLFYNKLYMNSPFINDNTLEHVGFIENGHSRMVYRPILEKKIRDGLKEVMEGDQLTPQQTAQLKHLSSPIRVECQRGTIRAGPNHQQIVCEGIVLKTAKSQAKIAMELLSMLPETLLGEHYRIIPKSLNNLLGYELYGQIVADTVNFLDKLRPITILYCHPSVFEDMYDCIKIQKSKHVEVHKFIIENCGAVSIEETNETQSKGKYIVVVPEEKVDSARTAIGKMFQEFQQSGGRPAAMSCLTAYQNFPLVNDNVTISGHAERLSQKIRDRYRNRSKTTVNQSSSASYSYHGSTTAMHEHSPVHKPTTTVPRSIIKKGTQYSNTATHHWPESPVVQRQRTMITNQVEERTVMSNLSPDDSAKTMMTNVSKMVETLGSAVNTLAKESANTNDTMKQMMMQQTTTMNNLMLIMARNEERRQEVPISVIHHTSTPSSTLTNSQYSQSQQSSI